MGLHVLPGYFEAIPWQSHGVSRRRLPTCHAMDRLIYGVAKNMFYGSDMTRSMALPHGLPLASPWNGVPCHCHGNVTAVRCETPVYDGTMSVAWRTNPLQRVRILCQTGDGNTATAGL